jgi:uncharacterized Fe-S cluster-containing protein
MHAFDPQPVHLNRAPAAVVSALGDQQVSTYISDGYVVLRIIRPFPNIPGCDGIEDYFIVQKGTDAARYRLHGIHRTNHFRVVAH